MDVLREVHLEVLVEPALGAQCARLRVGVGGRVELQRVELVAEHRAVVAHQRVVLRDAHVAEVEAAERRIKQRVGVHSLLIPA